MQAETPSSELSFLVCLLSPHVQECTEPFAHLCFYTVILCFWFLCFMSTHSVIYFLSFFHPFMFLSFMPSHTHSCVHLPLASCLGSFILIHSTYSFSLPLSISHSLSHRGVFSSIGSFIRSFLNVLIYSPPQSGIYYSLFFGSFVSSVVRGFSNE